MSQTKVKIDLKSGIIELEGSETFVSKYLNELKGQLNFIPKNTQAEIKEERSPLPASQKKTRVKPADGKIARSRKIDPEKFDMHGGDGKPSLKSFFEEKAPGGGNGDRIAVIGYYITETLGFEKFTEGQIEYAYRMLNLGRPNHLHQIMINTKNQKDYFENAPEGTSSEWILTRGGDIFVSDQLPKTK